ncbi:MAG: tRNA pseudouridine(38-40) synthase TruA [Terriglobia bacterium]
MRNLRLRIAYDGTDFFGWQRQPDRPTIQAVIEAALARRLASPVSLTGSGRTDTGVHAAGQIANFHTENSIPCRNLARALNDTLPLSIRILEALEAPPAFHARYDARAKVYRYRIFQASICPPFLARFVHHCPRHLDYARMRKAARLIEGRRDFTSFAGAEIELDRAPGSPSPRSKIRTVFSSRVIWRPRASLLLYEVRGDGFLRHMVRNIAGTLIEIGNGQRSPTEISQLLEARNRSMAGPTAPARGLSLTKVEYEGDALERPCHA